MNNQNNTKIENYLNENEVQFTQIIKLLGDASSRSYYKIVNGEILYCLSYDVGEFIQNKDFIKTTKLFENYVRTPKIINCKSDEFILQEYIGHVSLLLHITTNPRQRVANIKKAISDITKYQMIKKDDFKLVSKYEFDDQKIAFEFDLAEKYFASSYLKSPISEEVKNEMRNYFLKFFRENKDVVCHRDYHSRNLMVKDGELIHIDYQDARLGPITYDLVSLLEDAYIKYSEEEKKEFKNHFISEMGIKDTTEFEMKYNVVAAQRLFKVLGSFAYLKIDKNKNQYEKNIGMAFENLRQILEKISDIEVFEKFRIELNRAYYEN